MHLFEEWQASLPTLEAVTIHNGSCPANANPTFIGVISVTGAIAEIQRPTDGLRLQVVSPLFTGETKDDRVMSRRQQGWFAWMSSPGYDALRSILDQVSVYPYFPGTESCIPHDRDPHHVKISFPAASDARVPKGLVVRLHLLVALDRACQEEISPDRIIFSCIDGSGAFKFDSLKHLVDPFQKNHDVEVVFGRRPIQNSGMAAGRKEIEEFEQYLLFRHRLEELGRSFVDVDLDGRVLPDGQAGCWAFRLSAASRLPLTASSYEIEFDVLASTLESGLKAAYSEPLLMSEGPRHSSASEEAVKMSIRKMAFIERKLRISRSDVASAWEDFNSFFEGSDLLAGIPSAYKQELKEYCENEP